MEVYKSFRCGLKGAFRVLPTVLGLGWDAFRVFGVSGAWTACDMRGFGLGESVFFFKAWGLKVQIFAQPAFRACD